MRKTPKVYEVEVLNWEKWNLDQKKNEYRTSGWFKFSANFFEDCAVSQLNSTEKLLYVFILTRCAIHRSPSVSLLGSMIASSVPHRGIMIDSMLCKMSELGLIEIQKERKKERKTKKGTKPSKKAPPFLSESDLDALYQKYPKKVGKASGHKKLLKVINNEAKLQAFKLAMENYLKLIEEQGTELRFIKQWDTFVNNYEDYLDISTRPMPKRADLSEAFVDRAIHLLNSDQKKFYSELDSGQRNLIKAIGIDPYGIRSGSQQPKFLRKQWIENLRIQIMNNSELENLIQQQGRGE